MFINVVTGHRQNDQVMFAYPIYPFCRYCDKVKVWVPKIVEKVLKKI
jgi:hypothetical protein